MNTPSPYGAQGEQLAWDSTSLKWASTCPRYYLYAGLRGLEAGRSVHLIFGGIYASALEFFHKATARGVPYEECLHETIRFALIESWVHNLDSEGNRIPGTGHVIHFDSEAKSRDGLIRTIVWYLEEFAKSDYTTKILANGAAAAELSFRLPVDNDLIFCGHIDHIVEMEGHTFVQDQKTTGSALSQRTFRQFDTDIQMSMYTFAGKIIYNMPIKGVMIDAAEIGKGYTRFLRGFTFRGKSLLEEWYVTMLSLIQTTNNYTINWRESGADQAFPPNFTACGNYGGCPFHAICSTPASLREQFIKANYYQRKLWNPLESR